MLRDSLIFEVCDLIVAAVNAAALDESNFGGFRVVAELDPAATLILEDQFEGVRVLVIPNDKGAVPQTLSGLKQRTLTISIVVSSKIAELTAADVRSLDALAESISAVISTNVPDEMSGLIWTGENGDWVYNHEYLRSKSWFQAEFETAWQLDGGA